MSKKLFLLILITFFACMASNVLADPNLLCEYTFDQQTADDSSGNDHHGTIMGNATIVYDANRSSYVSYFPTGENGDFINCGGGGDWADPGGDDATISMWLKTENGFPRTYAFAANVDGIWRVSSYGANMRLYHLPSGGNLRGTNDTVGNDQWHHVAGTYDGSTRILYIDGKIDVSNSQSGPLKSSSNNFLIGGGYAGGSSCWRGYIDDVRFYTRALPQKELLEVAGINHAINQSPDGQTGLGAEVQLSWMAAYSESRYYNVYYGTDSNSVAGSQPGDLLGDTVLIADHDDTTLTQTYQYGTTYYWRVDVVDGATVYPDEGIYTFTIAPANSYDFLPADGLQDLPASTVVFMWTPGAAPIDGYNVYLGTSPTNLVKKNTALLTEPNYVPTLADNSTYYWKVEDVAATTISSPVMSFSTSGPVDPTLVGWWKFNEGSGNIALDYSGNGNNGTIYNADYTDGVLGSSLNLVRANQCYVVIPPAALADIADEVTFSFWAYGGEDLPVNTVFFQGTNANGRVFGSHLPYINSSVPNVHFDVGDGNSYDNIRKPAEEFEFKGQWNHWVFTKDAVAGEMKMYLNGNLWSSAAGLVTPAVPVDAFYIGGRTSDGTVNWDGLVDDFRIYNRELSGTEARDLYWQVFPPDYILIDDMESYDDSTKPIDGTGGWRDNDYNHDPGGNTIIGKSSLGNPAILAQSLGFIYSNKDLNHWMYYNSECVKIFNTAQDWTNDLAVLTINIHGNPFNIADKLYVALEDQAGNDFTIYHTDPNILLADSWQKWEISLSDFTGVNLAQVKYLYLGCGTRFDLDWQVNVDERSGTVYFDDVTVNPPSCHPDIQKPDGDITDDCKVDLMDVQVMANDWLLQDVVVVPEPVGDANILVQYTFDDQTASDSSGNGHDGTVMGDPTFVYDANRGSYVAYFPTGGTGNYIDCNDGTNWAVPGGSAASITAWFKTENGFPEKYAFIANVDGIWRVSSQDAVMRLYYLPNNNLVGNDDTVGNDQWHHYAGTYDGSKKIQYIDGKIDAMSNESGPLRTSTNPFLIGGGYAAGTRCWRGSIDDVRFYTRALSHGEILTLAGYTENLIITADSTANISAVGTPGEEIVNYKDFSVLADTWLDELLWP